MRYLFRLGTLAAGIALLPLPALAPPASAHAPAAAPTAESTIVARGDLVFLKGDPWRPSAPLDVAVSNLGKTATKGFFVLRLPAGLTLTSGGDCRSGTAQSWLCGGAQVPAGGRHTYRMTLTSTAAEPAFGVQKWGSVAGRDAAGGTEQPTEFRIGWPDRTSLGLRVTASPIVDSSLGLTASVHNTGSFAIGGYSLNVVTPEGVQVIWPLCSDSGRMDGAGCEILRPGVLSAGATDTVQIRLAIIGGPHDVRVYLAPTNRYTNDDTSVTLRLGGGGGAGGGDAAAPTAAPPSGPSTTTTATADATTASPPAMPVNAGSERPRTAPAGTAYALIGTALLAFGAGLLLLLRHLRRS